MTTAISEKARAKVAPQGGSAGGQKAPAASTAVAVKNCVGMNSQKIGELFEQYKLQIAQVLPKHLTSERILQLATTLVSRNPEIKSCTLPSIIGSVMNAAMLGLDLTPQFGECYLIPYNNSKTGVKELEFQIGYKGWIKLFRNTGLISNIYAECVREGDEFDVELGLRYDLKHKPNYGKRGKLLFTYCVVRFKDNAYNFKVLAEADVFARRARSKSYMNAVKYKTDKSPWITDEEAMWNKSAVLGIRAFIPSNTELAQAAMTDGATLTPDMFSSETKDVDPEKVRRTEIEDIDYSEQQQNQEPEQGQEEGAQSNNNGGQETGQEAGETGTKEQAPANENAAAAPKDPDPAKAAWLEAAGAQKERILRTAGKDEYFRVIGTLGYESIAEIPAQERKKVLDALKERADWAEKEARQAGAADKSGKLDL
jgi:recombination protein RecT